jgi:hypothetical protein
LREKEAREAKEERERGGGKMKEGKEADLLLEDKVVKISTVVLRT